jgi:hypothetical protein
MANEKRKGLICDVLRSSSYGDSTNGGVTARHNEVLLVGPGVDGPFEEDEAKRPTLKLVRRNIFGRDYMHAEPLNQTEEGNVGWMAGGNFIYTSDSRFPNQYPISVHDRQETARQYAENSI